MKNIRITFRLSPYQLARGLQTIKQLEPTYKLISLNDIVKVIYHDYLAKMTLNKLDEVPPEILNEIMRFIEAPAKSGLTLKDLIDLKKTSSASTEEPEPILPKEINEPNDRNKDAKASEFDDPNNTASDISTLTDFSPPKDWTE